MADLGSKVREELATTKGLLEKHLTETLRSWERYTGIPVTEVELIRIATSNKTGSFLAAVEVKIDIGKL